MLSKLVSLTLAAGAFALSASARTWTDTSGRSFEATLIRQEGQKVLLNVGGRQRSFQLTALSASDRAFLQGGGKSSPSTPKRNTTPTTPKRLSSSNSSQIQANTGIRIERLRSEPENSRWVYGSPNFEFVCDEDLGFAAIKQFAWMFESVWQFCDRLPFDIPRLRAEQKVRMKTYLIKEYEDYVRQGGSPGASGVYIPGQDVILIPFQSLDLNKRGGQKDANNTLRHEVTHQLMTGQSQQAGWFIEGSAEYVSTVPFDKTRLLADRHLKAITSYITDRGWSGRVGHNLGNTISLTSLESFMQPSYRRFQGQKNAYAHALILFTYFAKLDGQKDGANLAKYVAALQDGRPESDARKHLLAGRSYAELEKNVTSAWNLHGLRLKFE